MSDIPVPKVFLQVMCDCGHDMLLGNADPAGDGITTFNFEGVCGNVPEVCHHQVWTASVTISEVALQADAAARHAAQRERDKPTTRRSEREPEPAKARK